MDKELEELAKRLANIAYADLNNHLDWHAVAREVILIEIKARLSGLNRGYLLGKGSINSKQVIDEERNELTEQLNKLKG